jgi:fructokinase
MSGPAAPRAAIGIDLGGTKIEIIALDAAGHELLRRREPTPRDDYRGTIEAIARMVESAEAELGGRCSVGVSHPGAVSPATGLMKNANSTWLNGQRFDRDLRARLGRELAMANDANCLALSEATDGAAAGATVVFAVIIGTGTGGGIAAHGRILTGPNAIAGEWGHNPLPWPQPHELPGPDCYCGKQGCLETWISGPGFAADFARTTGEHASGPEIVARAGCGAATARAALDRYADRLARGLATVVNILDPDAIVLGGGMSNVAELYGTVPELLGRYLFSDTVRNRLAAARFGDSSGVRGAAWLGRDMAAAGA